MQATFRALADPTRREILRILARNEMTIGEVASQFDMTRAAVKKHLTILEQGKVISVHKAGRERVNRLEPRGLRPAYDWIAAFDRFWDDRLARLADAVEGDGSPDLKTNKQGRTP